MESEQHLSALLCLIELLNPLTEIKAAHMAEWNAFYRNEDDEEEQEEGEQSGGGKTKKHPHYFIWSANNARLSATITDWIFKVTQ